MSDKYGLYTLVCECDTSYDPEQNTDCPGCHKAFMFHKDFLFDTDKFLNLVASFKDNDDHAMDIIFDVYYQLHDKFHIMNDICNKIDVNKYDLSILIGFTVQTFKYSDQVLGHELLCNRIAQKMRDDGEPEERITDLIGNYRQAGNYWKEMKMLGAPEWLSGPNPNK